MMTTNESWFDITGLPVKEMERLLMCRPVCSPDEHCFCQATLDYIPHEQCCQCGQKRRKQGVTW